MAIKLRGNTTMDMVKAGASQRNNPSQPSIGDSYNKMVGQYELDISKFTGMLPSTNQFTERPGANGFYGSMSGLEGASMRLANAASQRSMVEAGYGSGLKKGEAANEYGLRDASTAKEYGLKGGLMSQEYGLRDASTAKEYGLKGGLLGQEYGLKEYQTAKMLGYLSPEEMQRDLQDKRREDDRRERDQYHINRRREIQARQAQRDARIG
jgi:hypothetical protein